MKVLRAAIEAMERGRPAALVMVVGCEGSAPRVEGARMLVYEDGSLVGTVGGGAVEYQAVKDALLAISVGKPRRFSPDLGRDLGMACGGSMDLYIEPLALPPRIVIFGAGHVGAAMAPLALKLDYKVTVVDDRPELATAERFPGCELLVGSQEEVAASIETNDRTYLLVVTHKHAHDEGVVRAFLEKPWSWLGLIGSRRKISSMFSRLQGEGVSPEVLERISAPVGLDIGAETPEEIAVAVAAEMVYHRRGAQGDPLPMSRTGRS